MTLLIEKPLALPDVEAVIPDELPVSLYQDMPPQETLVPPVAVIQPPTTEELAKKFRMEAHKAGFIAIDRMLHEGDDDRWH